MVTKTLLTILVILILASGVARQDTSSPWRKSSHGLRDTEKCATETQRIFKFFSVSLCLCGPWVRASQAVSAFTTAY